MNKPICTIIGGVNGAGKTTFALNYLIKTQRCHRFVNADLIASGLSPLSPDQQQITAGKMFLQQLKLAVTSRENFSFESTLSGKTHLKFISKLQADGWFVELVYLYLPNRQLSIARVAERVKGGGHNIELKSINRRYPKSLDNFINRYAPLCDTTVCLDNSIKPRKIIFIQAKQDKIIYNQTQYQSIINNYENP